MGRLSISCSPGAGEQVKRRRLDKPDRAKIGVIAGGALMIGCCIIGPLLVGAACVLALGILGELAAIGVLLAFWALTLWRMKVSRSRC